MNEGEDMKVLAIESSGLVASVAIADEDHILCEFMTYHKKTHSVTLMPMISNAFKAISLEPGDIDVIAVSGGPGSFTGLRIGSSTAKGLAHVWDVKIANVPTLDVLANNIGSTNALICPMMDARRKQVYTAIYAYEEGQIKRLSDMMCIGIQELSEIIKSYNKEIIFVGDGIVPNLQELTKSLESVKWQISPPHLRMQRAAVLADLGIQYAKEGKLESHMEHAPIYLRKPQAEREYDEKNVSNRVR